MGFYGQEVYDAIYNNMVAPGEQISSALAEIAGEFKDSDMGYFFWAIEWIAEKDALMEGKTLAEVVQDLAGIMGHVMFTRPEGGVPSADESEAFMGRVLEQLQAYLDVMQKIAGGSASYQDVLDGFQDGAEREAFAAVLDTISEGVGAAAGYVQYLVDSLKNGDTDAVRDYFTGYAGMLFGQQIEEIARVGELVREDMKRNSDSVDRLIRAIENGRGKEVLTAVLVKFAHEAEKLGVDPQDFMRANFLKQLDREINPEGFDKDNTSGFGPKSNQGRKGH